MAGDFVQEIRVVLKLDGEEKLAKLSQGFKDAGVAGAAAAEATKPMAVGVQKVSDLLDRMGKTYERTGAVSTRSIASLTMALKDLEAVHGKNIQAAKSLSDAEKEMAATASAAIREATRRQKEFNDELRRVRSQTMEWTGFGNTIGSLGPKFQAVTQSVGGAFAALTAGLAIGKQLDKWLTDNISGWQRWKDRVADAIVRAFSGIKASTSRGGVLADLDPETMAGYSQKMQQAILARSMASRKARDLELEMSAAGVTTMVQAVKMQEQLDALLKKTEAAGLGTSKTLKDNAGIVSELVDMYRSAGKTVPDQIAKWAKALEAFTEKAKKVKDVKLFDLPTGMGFGVGRDIALGTGFNQNVSAFEAAWGTAEEFDARMLDFKDAMKAAQKPFDEATEKNAKKWQEACRRAAEEFNEGLGEGLLTLAAAGGLDFGESAASAVAFFMKAPIGKIFSDAVLDAFGGGAMVEGDTEGNKARTIQNQKIGVALEGAMSAVSVIGANQAGQASDTETIISMTALGASIGSMFAPVLGTIIGAIAGLLVGAISALASSVGDSYSYARLGITDGQAVFDPTQNIPESDRVATLARMQAAFDEFYSGYLKILMKFPLEILPNMLTSMDITPIIGDKNIGADFGSAASKMFWQDVDKYLSGGMPREIAARFKGYFEGAFVGMGMGAEKFEMIWGQLQGMDPKKAMEMLGLLADAVIGFAKSLAFFGSDLDTLVGGGFDIKEGMFQQVYRDMNRSFAAQLGMDDSEIIRLGSALGQLTGEKQIQAANELASLMDERMQKEKDFLQSIIRGIEEINRSFADATRDLMLEGMVTPGGTTDYQAQVDYLMAYADQLRAQMGMATSPEEVQRLSGELLNTILQIKQIGTAAGGENAAGYREWAIDALEAVRQESVDRMKALAEEVEAANDAFLSAIQGFIDAFLNATDYFEYLGEGDEGGGVDTTETPGGGKPRPDQFEKDSITLLTDNNTYLGRIATAVEREPHVVINMPTGSKGQEDFSRSVIRGRTASA